MESFFKLKKKKKFPCIKIENDWIMHFYLNQAVETKKCKEKTRRQISVMCTKIFLRIWSV